MTQTPEPGEAKERHAPGERGEARRGGALGRLCFRLLLVLLGAVALVAGGATVLLGATSIPGAGSVSPTADSELRFYAVWYVGAGLAMLRSARDPWAHAATIRALAVLLFVAGAARALSWLTVGAPHALAGALMVVELVLAVVLIGWHRALAPDRPRRGAAGPRT